MFGGLIHSNLLILRRLQQKCLTLPLPCGNKKYSQSIKICKRKEFIFADGVPDSDVMSSTATLHRGIVQCKAGRVFLVQQDEPARTHPVRPEEGVMKTAAAALMLVSYRNQCLHVFVRPALLATAMHITKSTQRGQSMSQFMSTFGDFSGFCFSLIHYFVHRWAPRLLLLPAGCFFLWIHLHPWRVITGNPFS